MNIIRAFDGLAGTGGATRRRGRCAPAAALVALLLVPSAPGHAEDRLGTSRDQDAAYKARSQGNVRSLDSVVGGGRSGGKVLDAELNGSHYRVKVLDNDGRVRRVDVDASSGSGRGSTGDARSRGSDESSGGRGRGRGR